MSDYELNPFHITITRESAPCWRCREVRYFDANKRQGNDSANIYVRAVTANGTPAYNQSVVQAWPDGGHAEKTLRPVTNEEILGDPTDGTPFAGCDFFMSEDGYRPSPHAEGPYQIRLSALGYWSDVVSGFGLAPNRAHDTYRVEFYFDNGETPEPPEPPSGDIESRLAAVEAQQARIVAALRALAEL